MGIKHDIVDSLKKLKQEYGVVSIKAEFEAEGSRKDELIMLRDFVETADLGLIIKIGGCEAVHDLDQCKLLDATGVMAPMIETPFAMKKYRGAFTKVYGNKDVERIINAETKTCLANFDEILKIGDGFLTGVTVGRSDLSASMDIERKDIESEPVFNATRKLCEKAKARGLVTNFGGNIGIESIPFIIRMNPYIDRFETRKVVLSKNDNPEFLKQAIKEALGFELLYLKFKSGYYNAMATEDTARITRLENQIKSVE
ncbi:MAG: aldolase/citrate lyase family protein [Bilifractor sp.]